MALEPDTVVQVLLRERLRVTATAAAVVRDVHAADDIFQQVVLSALESRKQLKDSDHLLAWAARTARHRAVDLARRRQLRSLPDEVLDLIEDPGDAPAEAVLTDRAEALHRCLGKLDGPTRDILRVRYDDGLTAVAIAGRLRRTADAVYQALSRTHRALRTCVERELAAATVSEVAS